MKENKKVGKIIIIVITIVILILLALVVLIKTGVIKFDFNNKENNDDITIDNNIKQSGDEQVLKSYRYYMANFNNDEGWYLNRLDREISSYNLGEGEKVKKVSDTITSNLENVNVLEGYYFNDKLYKANISDGKLTIDVIDFSQEEQTMTEYLNIDIPSNSKGNLQSIIYMDDEYIYLSIINTENRKEEIYLLDVQNRELKKLYTYTNEAPYPMHDSLFGWMHNNNLIVVSYYEIIIINQDDMSIQNLLSEEDITEISYESFKIKNGELYFTIFNTDYPEENSNKRIEKTITYKYNFDSHEKTIINEKSKTFN